jgi:hypothetical protein
VCLFQLRHQIGVKQALHRHHPAHAQQRQSLKHKRRREHTRSPKLPLMLLLPLSVLLLLLLLPPLLHRGWQGKAHGFGRSAQQVGCFHGISACHLKGLRRTLHPPPPLLLPLPLLFHAPFCPSSVSSTPLLLLFPPPSSSFSSVAALPSPFPKIDAVKGG